MVAIDNLATGLYDIEQFTDIPNEFADLLTSTAFSFVPKVSALDIGSGNTSLNLNDYTKAYETQSLPSSPKNTPFDHFTTAFQTNESHLEFTYKSANRILDTLKNQTINVKYQGLCNSIYQNIQGNSAICTSNSTFSIAVPSGSSINWQVDNGITIVNGQGTSNFVLKLTNSSFSGNANISTDCGQIIAEKEVYMGSPNNGNTGSLLIGPSNAQPGTIMKYSAPGQTVAPGATSYQGIIPFPGHQQYFTFQNVTNNLYGTNCYCFEYTSWKLPCGHKSY